MKRMEQIERALLKKEVPVFRIGDTVRIHLRVKEGEKERIQVFEGVVIGRKGGRNRETFRVRKVSYGVGVERIFPIHSPFVEKIDVIREGKTRRAKLYFLRGRKGKAARLSERGAKTEVSKELSDDSQDMPSPEPVEVEAKVKN